MNWHAPLIAPAMGAYLAIGIATIWLVGWIVARMLNDRRPINVAGLDDLAENPPAPTDALRNLFADYNEAISTGALITDLPRKETSP